MQLELNLPLAFAVEDYHDFDFYCKLLCRLSPKFKLVREVAFGPSVSSSYSLYWSVIYTGRKPSKDLLRDTIVNAGFDINDENSRFNMRAPVSHAPLLLSKPKKKDKYWNLITQISEEKGVTKGEARRLYKLANMF